jgi:quercetin dioxygenase-like cupin family protein
MFRLDSAMNINRRDLSTLLPALVAAAAGAQTPLLPSKTYSWESLTAKKDPQNGMEVRNVFKGQEHNGCVVAVHISSLPPGQSPHPPHHHEHEEMMLLKEGTLECTVSGKATRIGPGGLFYIASNEEHSLKNVGAGTAQYFVVELGA